MTWGKAILPWSPDPDTAIKRTVYLNHKYALDGCDPCSYSGILWCYGVLPVLMHALLLSLPVLSATARLLPLPFFMFAVASASAVVVAAAVVAYAAVVCGLSEKVQA